MKMKRTNKFFVILLTLAMIVSMFPMTAFASAPVVLEVDFDGAGSNSPVTYEDFTAAGMLRWEQKIH